jgi:hypothetical protein
LQRYNTEERIIKNTVKEFSGVIHYVASLIFEKSNAYQIRPIYENGIISYVNINLIIAIQIVIEITYE